MSVVSMLDNERAACLRMLREIAGGPVEIVASEPLGGDWAPVERMVLAGGHESLVGRSVVVKTRRHGETGWGGDPANLVAEYRALAALHDAGVEIVPEPLAWDDPNGVLVMRDLAPARSVEQVLLESGPGAATAALVALASSVGAMHAATTRMESEPWNTATVLDQGLRAHWDRVSESARRRGFPDSGMAEADVAAVAAALDDERWRALTHGDVTPANALLVDETAFLIDFEGAGFRHCLLDGAMLSLSFPQYGRWAALPGEVVTRIAHAYRTALATGLPLVMDDDAYGLALATGCAAWVVIRLARLEVIARTDQEPDQALRRRSQIVHTLESCLVVAGRTDAYPRLMDWLASIALEMRRRWPEATARPRQFPAYADDRPGS